MSFYRLISSIYHNFFTFFVVVDVPKCVALPVTKILRVEYRRDIQGLRALAVIFVLIFHINPQWLPGGFIGVDVFFVISGFLVSSIILQRLDNNTFTFTDFYIGRLKRIVPAYYFLLLFVGVAGAIVLMGNDVNALKSKIAHAMVFDTDRVYAQGQPYFGMQLQQDTLLHTWTIAVEMKFYLLLPFLLFWIKRKYLAPVITCLSLLLLLYATYQIEIAQNTTPAYYSLFTRIPEFCTGVLLALAPKKTIRAKAWAFSGFAGLAILILCAFLFNHETHFPGVAAMLPCLGAVLLIAGGNGAVNRLLALRPFEFTGALSYSIYLWHWPIIAFMRYYTAANEFNMVQAVLIVIATFAGAWVSYAYCEKVFRKNNFRFFAVAMLPVGLVLVGLYLGIMQRINHKVLHIPEEYSGPSFGLKSHNIPNVETFGDTLAQPEILLIGNSHALCMKAYLNLLGKKHHFSFRTITCDSYPALEGINEDEALKRGRIFDYRQSQKLVGLTKEEIATARVVIMVLNSWDILPSLKPALKNMVKSLKKGQQLILISPFPGLDKNPVQVNRGTTRDKQRQQTYKVLFDNNIAEIEYLKKDYPCVQILSFEGSGAFKTAPFYNDTIMYYDSNHLNRYGAEVLAKHTEKQFMNMLNNALPK